MPESIGFIGLGRIGLPVAMNLARAGHDVVAFDLLPRDEYVEELEKTGARVTQNPASAVADRDIVITLLPDSAAVEAVVMSEATQSNLREGMIWIEMSSGFPPDTRRLADRLGHEFKVELVDAPICNGGVPGAYEGRMTLCLGGSNSAVERVLPALEAVANDIVHVGPVGAGHTIKLLSNYATLGINGLISEVYAIAVASGFDLQKVTDVLRHCVAAKFVNFDTVDRELLSTPSANEPANFRLQLARKDLRYLAAQAATLGVFSPMGEGAHALYLVAERTGFGDAEGTRGPWMALQQMLND